MERARAGSSTREQLEVLVVDWDCWDAVEVFRRCRFSKLVGMSMVQYDTIPRPEIQSVMGMRRIKRKRQGEVLDQVLVMEAAALEALNAK